MTAAGDPRELVERRWRDVAAIEAAYARGQLDDDGWHAAMAGLVGPAYLAGTSPWQQSGKSGDWAASRRPLLLALDRDGSFLDVGCANGYLLETLTAWAAEDGIRLEPYGIDIVPELLDLARSRLPGWADRLVVANARDWRPGRRFHYVRTGLDYVPEPRRPSLLEHLLAHVVASDGRLIVGVQNELVDAEPLADVAAGWGFQVAGRAAVPHRDPRARRTLFWIDAPGR